jgi:hypothetical protein
MLQFAAVPDCLRCDLRHESPKVKWLFAAAKNHKKGSGRGLPALETCEIRLRVGTALN